MLKFFLILLNLYTSVREVTKVSKAEEVKAASCLLKRGDRDTCEQAAGLSGFSV